MELKKVMLESEMEQYQIKSGYNPFDNEGTADSVSVFDNAIDILGYTSYRLEGNGQLDDTYIFVNEDLEDETEKSPQDILKDVDQDLKDILEEYIDGMVESHLEGWGERYFLKSKDEINTDLYINHDPSIEIDSVSGWLGRELTAEECDIVETYFNESIIYKLKN